MSSKDYIAIAAIIKDQVERLADPEFPWFFENGGAFDAVVGIANKQADYFAADNEHFDRARFLTACGVS